MLDKSKAKSEAMKIMAALDGSTQIDLISQKSALINKESEINKKINVLISKLNNQNYIKNWTYFSHKKQRVLQQKCC